MSEGGKNAEQIQEIMFKIRSFIKEGANPATNKPYYNHVWEAIDEWIERPQTKLVEKAEKKKPGVAITHSKELLNLIQINCTDQIEFVRANYTAKGVEAVVKDKFDGKIYILKIEGKNE